MAATNPDALAGRFAALIGDALRAPATIATDDQSGDPILTFSPPLDPATEQPVYDRLLRLAKVRVLGITPAEWQALEPDVTNLKTYLGIASPTAAQTAAATKAIVRVLGAILRS
jgi:hypothetical protein